MLDKKTIDRISILIFLLICFMALIVLVPCSSAFNISSVEKGENYIIWTYQSPNVTNSVTVDGKYLENIDVFAKTYAIYDLLPNTEHTIIIVSYNTTNATTNYIYDSQYTLSHTFTSSENTFDILYLYIFFYAAIILIIIGLYVPFISLLGCGFSILGIVGSINVSMESGFIFMCIFCAGIIVAFRGGN